MARLGNDITTTPNPLVARLHDRMPVILPDADAESAWLSAELAREDAGALLAPLDERRTTSTPAHPRVNRSGLDDEGPDLLVAP